MSDNNIATKKAPLVNLSALIADYKRYWVWVMVSILLFVGLGVIAVLKKQPSSEIVAQVLISDENSKSFTAMSELAGMFGGGSFGSNRSIDDEMVIIMAHSVMKKTVQDLNLNVDYKVKKNILKEVFVYDNPPIVLQYDKSIADTLGVGLKFELDVDENGIADITVRGRKNKKIARFENQTLPAVIEIPYGAFMFTQGASYISGKSLNETVYLSSYDAKANDISELLTVDLSQKKTDVMSITFVTTDAEYGKLLVNTLVKNYNDLTVRQKQAFNEKSLEFLEDRIHQFANEVDLTEKEVESFLGSRDLVNPDAQAGIILNQTTKQEVELVQSENEYELLMMAIEFLTDEAHNTSMLPIMPSISSLTGLIEGYNSLILQRLNLQASAKGDNIALKALNERIDIVKSNLLTALNKQRETSEFEIKELRKQYARSKSKLETVPGIEREYVNIMRQQTLKEQLYTYLLRQREETELAIAGAHPRGVIIDEAYVADDQLGMSSIVVLAIFVILGLLAPAGLIILKWNVSKVVALDDQAEAMTGLTRIIEIDVDEATCEPVVVKSPDSREASQYRLLRSNFLSISSVESGLDKIVTIVGTVDSDRSACSAVNFAASLVSTGRKVLLIDTISGNTSVARVLGLREVDNVKSITGGTMPVVTSLPIADSGALDIVTTGSPEPDSANFVASVGFSRYMDAARDSYDFIVINASGVKGNIASVESLAGITDAVFLTYTVDDTEKETLVRLSRVCAEVNKNCYLVSLS